MCSNQKFDWELEEIFVRAGVDSEDFPLVQALYDRNGNFKTLKIAPGEASPLTEKDKKEFSYDFLDAAQRSPLDMARVFDKMVGNHFNSTATSEQYPVIGFRFRPGLPHKYSVFPTTKGTVLYFGNSEIRVERGSGFTTVHNDKLGNPNTPQLIFKAPTSINTPQIRRFAGRASEHKGAEVAKIIPVEFSLPPAGIRIAE